MKTIRRLSYAAIVVAFTHLVFGAIVRISGSGMGCGDNWPKCYGRWFPPFDRPDLIIEWSHRLLALVLLVTLVSLAVATWRRRAEPGVSGKGGVMRMVGAAAGLWIAPALLGALTVKLGNPPGATVAHWMVAMALVAVLLTGAIRAGAFAGHAALEQRGTRKATRSALIAAALAFVAVAMGGLTAKWPSAAIACRAFPLCGLDPAAADVPGAMHIQMTHRILAFLLFFHLLGMLMAFRKRTEAPVVKRALMVAFSLVLVQLAVAGAMIGMRLPPVLRSLHEAVGVSIWLSTYAFWYLAHRASKPVGELAATMPDEGRPHTIAVIVARGADL